LLGASDGRRSAEKSEGRKMGTSIFTPTGFQTGIEPQRDEEPRAARPQPRKKLTTEGTEITEREGKSGLPDDTLSQSKSSLSSVT
jgi:hypothetical protein